jgi:hypothetical protein
MITGTSILIDGGWTAQWNDFSRKNLLWKIHKKILFSQ